MGFTKRLVAGVTSVAIATCGLTYTPAVASPQDELVAARQELELYGRKLAELQTQLVKGADELNITESQIVRLQSEADATKKKLKKAQGVLAQHMRENYRAGNASVISILLESETVEDLVSRVYYLDKIAKRNAEAISTVQELQTNYELQIGQLEEQHEEQEQMIEDAILQAKEYHEQMLETQQYYNELDAKIQGQLEAETEVDARQSTQTKSAPKQIDEYGVITDGVQNAMTVISEEDMYAAVFADEASGDSDASKANDETNTAYKTLSTSDTQAKDQESDLDSEESDVSSTKSSSAASSETDVSVDSKDEQSPNSEEPTTQTTKESETQTEQSAQDRQKTSEAEDTGSKQEQATDADTKSDESKDESRDESKDESKDESDERRSTDEESKAEETKDEVKDEVEVVSDEQPAAEENEGSKEESTQASSSDGGDDRSEIIAKAYEYLGVPYVWGGKSPDGFDCSGLTTYVYENSGVDVGGNRTTYDLIDYIQDNGNWKTTMDELEPGDMIFPSEGHVAIYLGDGRMLHAPHEGDVVREADVYSFYGGGWAG